MPSSTIAADSPATSIEATAMSTPAPAISTLPCTTMAEPSASRSDARERSPLRLQAPAAGAAHSSIAPRAAAARRGNREEIRAHRVRWNPADEAPPRAGAFPEVEVIAVTGESLLAHEALLRAGCFAGVFALMAAWETFAPRRPRSLGRGARWPHNVGVVVVNTVLLRLLFPVAAVGMAALAAERDWGLLNNVAVPWWLAVVTAVVALDLVIYLQHVMFHALPVLWRIHRMHHADLDIDVSTGVRFHPIEILLSMLIKMAAVAVLGPPVVGVLVFEVLLNATAMFNHSNAYLPLRIDRVLRWLVVTPDMHRVHHSWDEDETNSNFGFNLPWWDRLFGTYRAQPRAGHEGMTIGIRTFRDRRRCDTLGGMLAIPFVGKVTGYAINRRDFGGE